VGGSCPEPKVVFLNFDGAELHKGDCDDALANCSRILEIDHVSYPRSPGTSATRRMIIERVQGHFRPFHVRIVTTRPTSGEYSMVMIGGRYSDIGGSLEHVVGISAIDCGNTKTRNIGFVFLDTEDSFSWSDAVAQMAGRVLGLEGVGDQDDIMAEPLPPADFPGDASFHDREMRIVNPACGQTTQNDVALLLQNVGPACL
jgi:hypothetical protein